MTRRVGAGLSTKVTALFALLSLFVLLARAGTAGSGAGGVRSVPRPQREDGSAGCLRCHAGIEPMHPEAELTCVECHGGDARARSKADAHVSAPRGVDPGADEQVALLGENLAWRRFVNPMDLRVVDKTCAECHPKLTRHLESSLHGTTAGHLSDGFYEMGITGEKGGQFSVFPVRRDKDQEGEVERLVRVPEFVRKSKEQTLADHYPDLVRKECMECHLYSRGSALEGRIGFDGDYRGEGCAACHVPYASNGLSRSADREARRTEPGHPLRHSMVRAPETSTCVSCHNGDASIGLQFRGLSQLPPRAPGGPDVAGTTDELLHRAFYLNDPEVVPPDVHHASGMHCVDCHTLGDVMGDGQLHGQMEHAVEISCQACHGTFEEPTKFVTERGNRMRNLFRRDDSVYLRSKVTGEEHRVVQVVEVLDPKHPDHNPKALAAMTSAHANVECYTCHAGWNINFLGFHFYRNEALSQLDLVSGLTTPGRVTTQEKVFTTWKSFYAGLNEAGRIAPYLTGFSTMGSVDDAEGRRVLDQVMPVTERGLSGMTMVHHQLHSIRPTARSCVECHRSPSTWGLGSPNFRLGRRLAFVADRRGIEIVALAREQMDASVPLTKFVLADVVDLELSTEPLQGHARVLYASEGARGIHAIDVSNPVAPVRMGFVATPMPRGLALAGDHLYCADGFAGLSIFDVSDPTEMKLVGRLPTLDAHEVSLAWPHAYLADGAGGLAIIDVRNPSQPKLVGGIESRSADPSDRVEPGESRAIDVRLIFQNSRPRVDEDGVPLDIRTPARQLCALLDASKGAILIDVTEPSTPEVIWPLTIRQRALRSTQSIEYRGLALRSKVDLAAPQGGARTRERDYLYVLQEENRGSGLLRSFLNVLDVTDPAQTSRAARLRIGEASEMLVAGAFYNPPFLQNMVVVPGSEGVAAIDVSASQAPVSLGFLGDIPGAYAVALEEFPLDQMLDVSGRELKDVSHAGSRWLRMDEIGAILSVPGERLGTTERRLSRTPLPATTARRELERHDPQGKGWVVVEENRDPPVGEDYDGNGIVTLLEILRSQGAWRGGGTTRETGDAFLRTRVDENGDLSRLLDGVNPYEFDRGDDGSLDRKEMTAAFFAALDLDGDEKLSFDELSRCPGPLRRLRYGVLDGLTQTRLKKVRDGGRIGLRDFEIRDEDWAALDADGDGEVRLDVPRDAVRSRRGFVSKGPEWPTRQPSATGLPPGTTPDRLLESFDRDRDGILSRREVADRPELFLRLDRSGDGRATLEEIELLTRRSEQGGVDVSPDGFHARWDLDGDGRVSEWELPLDLAARLGVEVR